MLRKVFILILGVMISLVPSATIAMEDHQHDHEMINGASTENDNTKVEEVKKEQQEPMEVGNKICPVSGEAVDSMGGAYKVEYIGKIYNLCCRMCMPDFKRNAEKYIPIIEKELSEDK